MFIISILTYTLLTFGTIIFLVLFVPYDYFAYGKKYDKLSVKGTVSWLFGGVKINYSKDSLKASNLEIMLFGIKKKVSFKKIWFKITSTKKNSKPKELKDPKQNIKIYSSFIKYINKEFIKKIVEAIFRIIKTLSPRRLSIHARMGFEDPSYTGLICALNSTFYEVFKKYDIKLIPVFDDEVIEGRFLIKGRVWLPYIILVGVRLLITKPFRNIWISKIKLKFIGGN